MFIFLVILHLTNLNRNDMSFTKYLNLVDHHGIIPKRYTCDGVNNSPPLKWNGIPKEAQSMVLIVDDLIVLIPLH